MRQAPGLLATLAIVTACAAPPPLPAKPVAFVEQFKDAAAFVPDGMDRIWLIDWRGIAPIFFTFSEATVCDHLELRCGRKRAWPGWTHLQAFDGVLVEDYGAAPVPAARREELGESSEPISGMPMWHRPERTVGVNQITPATWATIVDERFVVIADSQQLMRDALTQPRGSITAAMLADVEVPADVRSIVYHQMGEHPGLNGTWMAQLIATEPLRFEFWGSEKEPYNPANETRFTHRMHRDTDVWQLLHDGPVDEFAMQWTLSLAVAFGLMVFI